MAYYIFLKSLRSLEEFRKSPHAKIPPKSPSTNFQSLDKFKNPIFNSEILFLLIWARPTLRPTRPLSPPSPLAMPSPAGQKRPAGPSSPRVGRVLTGNTFSISDHAFPSRPPPLISLTTGPWLSASSPTSSHPSSPVPPPIPGHRAPLRSAPRVPSDHYHLAFIFPPLIPLLNLSSSRPSSMSLKTLTPALTAQPPLPAAPLAPIKGEHPPRASLHLSPLSFSPL
jgi:hypothetical protein